MIRIVVADDHPVVREGLVAMLETQPDFEVVGEAATGAEALALVAGVRSRTCCCSISRCPSSTASACSAACASAARASG